MNSKRTTSPARNRRQFPRIAIVLPVVLQLNNGDSVNVRTFDISPGGMQIRCSRAVAAKLCPTNNFIPRQKAPLFLARLLLPLHSGRVPVEARCCTMHVHLLQGAAPDAEVIIGLEFRGFRSQKYLRRFIWFIEEHLVPIEDFEVFVHGEGKSSPASTVNGVARR